MFEKNDQEMSQIIETGVDAILSGETTLEAFGAQHPEQTAAVRAELELAQLLVSYREQVNPRAGFVTASRKRLLTRMQQEASSRGAKRSFFGLIWPQRVVYQWAAALFVLIILMSSTGGMIGLAQTALPGDSLYPVKQTSEQLAYALTINDVNRVEVSAAYAERRLGETAALLEKASFTAASTSIQSFEKQVDQTVALLEDVSDAKPHEKKTLSASLKKEFNEHAAVLGKLQTNAPEDVRGSLQHAETTVMLGAISVEEETKDLVDPTVTPLPTETLTPTASPVPTGTYTPVPTDTLVPSATPEEKEPVSPLTEPDPTDPSEKKITKTPRPTNENRPLPPTPRTHPTEKPPKPEKTSAKNK